MFIKRGLVSSPNFGRLQAIIIQVSEYIRSGVQKFPAWPTFYCDRNKTTLLFFNIVSLYFNTLFNWYINLTIDGTIYPSKYFPSGAAFVCQAGNFWTLLRIICLCSPSNCQILNRHLKVTTTFIKNPHKSPSKCRRGHTHGWTATTFRQAFILRGMFNQDCSLRH